MKLQNCFFSFTNSPKYPTYNTSISSGRPVTSLLCCWPQMPSALYTKFLKTCNGHHIYRYTYSSMVPYLQDFNAHTDNLADVCIQKHVKIVSILTKAVLLLSASNRFFFSLSNIWRAWFSFASKAVMFWFAFSSSRWSLCVSRTAANHFFRHTSSFKANRRNSSKRKVISN